MIAQDLTAIPESTLGRVLLILIALIGAAGMVIAAIGGGWSLIDRIKGRRANQEISGDVTIKPNPLRMEKVEGWATKRELDAARHELERRLERDVDAVKIEIAGVHTRLNSISTSAAATQASVGQIEATLRQMLAIQMDQRPKRNG